MSRLFSPALLALLLVFAVSVRADEPEAADPKPTPAEGADAAGEKYLLRYKFEPGETLRSEVIHQAKVRTTVQGNTQTAETKSISIKIWRIESVADDGSATFVHMVDSIDMWQRATGRKELHYNSKTDDEIPPGYEAVAAAVGVPLSTVTMDTRGEIIDREENHNQPTAASSQMTMPLPENEVVIGESWTSPSEIEAKDRNGAVKKIQTRQKFTLESVEDGIATVKIDAQILTPITDPAIEVQLVQRLSSGQVKFDLAAGRVLSQQLDLDRHIVGFGGPASSMHYVTRFSEELLPPETPAAETAEKSETAEKKR
ncbi:MAG: hypothetical protein DWQ37_20935 [Planctomycetota bacterium]|nr:MAG: hypothetical protein DWQ37_20935 [Planctomycetota bacterium]